MSVTVLNKYEDHGTVLFITGFLWAHKHNSQHRVHLTRSDLFCCAASLVYMTPEINPWRGAHRSVETLCNCLYHKRDIPQEVTQLIARFATRQALHLLKEHIEIVFFAEFKDCVEHLDALLQLVPPADAPAIFQNWFNNTLHACEVKARYFASAIVCVQRSVPVPVPIAFTV